MAKHPFGLAALLISIIALGLAVVPMIALDEPVTLDPLYRDPPPPPAGNDGVTLKYKSFSVTFGGDKDDESAANPDAETDRKESAGAPAPTHRERLLKTFRISAVACALIALVLGPIAWVRETQPALSGTAMGIACLALIWQYILIGIIVGVAIAVLLFVLSHFS